PFEDSGRGRAPRLLGAAWSVAPYVLGARTRGCCGRRCTRSFVVDTAGTRVECSTDAFSPLPDDDNTSTVALPTQSVSGIRIQLNTVPPGSGSVRRVGHPIVWTRCWLTTLDRRRITPMPKRGTARPCGGFPS